MQNNNKTNTNNLKKGIDESKIKYLNNLEELVINTKYDEAESISTNKTEIYKNDNSNNKNIIEHANYYHDFKDNKLTYKELIPLYFIKDNKTSKSKICVVKNIKMKDNDTLEIVRDHLYLDFFNEMPYNTERIIIKRKGENSALLALKEDKFKKEAISFGFDSLMKKTVRFKAFRNANEMLFFQNIFYYNCILETHQYYQNMNLIPDKKKLALENLYYHEHIKNLF